MKLSRSVVVGLLVAGFVVLLSAASFASGGKEKYKVKLLKDSAVALQQSNPSLSAALTKFANEEEKEIGKSDEKELEGKEEKLEENSAEANIKVVKDAAYALQESRPELSGALIKLANEEALELKGEQKDDKEEAGEKEENERINKK